MSRLALGVVVLVSLLACGGGGDAASSAPAEAPVAGAATAPAAPPTMTIPVFAPSVGERFAVASDWELDFDIGEGPAAVKVQQVEHVEGEVTVRTVSNGRVQSVNVRVTGGKETTVSPEGREEALPDSVGKEYVVTRVDGGESRVERADGARLREGEDDGPRRLGDEVFTDRTTPIVGEPGVAVEATAFFGEPDEGETTTGSLALGRATPDCAAPFSGSLAGTVAEGTMTMAMSMTGDVCVEPATGLVTRSTFAGSATLGDADAKGRGTLRLASTAKKL